MISNNNKLGYNDRQMLRKTDPLLKMFKGWIPESALCCGALRLCSRGAA